MPWFQPKRKRLSSKPCAQPFHRSFRAKDGEGGRFASSSIPLLLLILILIPPLFLPFISHLDLCSQRLFVVRCDGHNVCSGPARVLNSWGLLFGVTGLGWPTKQFIRGYESRAGEKFLSPFAVIENGRGGEKILQLDLYYPFDDMCARRVRFFFFFFIRDVKTELRCTRIIANFNFKADVVLTVIIRIGFSLPPWKWIV